MPSTRSATGNSRPRVHATVEAPTRPVASRKRGPAKSTAVTTKKPKAKTTKTGRVTKKKSTLKDKAEGVVLKAEGALTGKEGKKAAGTKKIRGTTNTKPKTKKVL
jgi:hypothetical protein